MFSFTTQLLASLRVRHLEMGVGNSIWKSLLKHWTLHLPTLYSHPQEDLTSFLLSGQLSTWTLNKKVIFRAYSH